MITSNREAGYFHVRVQNRFSSYSSQAHPVYCGLLPLLVIEFARPVAHMTAASVFLFPKKLTLNLLIKIVGIGFVRAFVFRKTQYCYLFDQIV